MIKYYSISKAYSSLIYIGGWLVLLISHVGFTQNHIVRVYGKITDIEGANISHARVSFISHDNGDTTTIQTDALGVFSVDLILTQTGVVENHFITVSGYQLYQNYPNPFNPTTIITFMLPYASQINLAIFNLRGQLVRQLIDGFSTGGLSQIVWNGTDEAGYSVPAGIYFYRLESNGFTKSMKMLLLDGSKSIISRSNISSPNSILKSIASTQKSYKVIVEKQGFYPFVDDNFVISSKDNAIEKNISLRRINYFPLSLGNNWTFVYKNANQDQEKEVTFSIIDKKMIGEHEYYEFNIWPWFLPLYFDKAFMRKTEQGDIVLRIANEEILIYEFSDTTLDSMREAHVDSLPGYTEELHFVSWLTSISDNVVIEAGTFKNCYRFISGIKEIIDSGMWIWFAPDIGPVRFQPTNIETDYRLKSVNINGK